jgi:hypothetical protein
MNFRIAFPPSAPSANSAVNSLAEEKLAAAVSANLQHATRLRQSILLKAFEGKLSVHNFTNRKGG